MLVKTFFKDQQFVVYLIGGKDLCKQADCLTLAPSLILGLFGHSFGRNSKTFTRELIWRKWCAFNEFSLRQGSCLNTRSALKNALIFDHF